MATLTFQRATWQLQISRTTRSFSVSFTAALPHRTKRRQLHSQPIDPRRPNRHDIPQPRVPQHHQARTAFTSTKVYQAQQAQQPQQAPPPAQVRSRPPYATASKIPKPTGASPPYQNTPPPTPDPDLPDLTSGLSDQPIVLDEGTRQVDWARSFHGLSTEAFPKEAADVLLQPIPNDDIEVKPDGILYLPEIKYRRILNKAFGPGGWGLAPRGETIVTAKAVTREYALVVLGRYAYPSSSYLLPFAFYPTLTPPTDSFPSPAANKTTSPPTAFPPLPKAASPTP